MSNNNNKPPLDLTESLLVFDKAQAPSTTTPTVNELDYEGISLVERSSRDVKPREKNDSLGISGINQPDATTPNLSHSNEASTSTDETKSDDEAIGFLLDCVGRGEYRRKQRPPSICKVSRILRQLSKNSYKPQLVSIGPIHREDKKLQKFDWLKENYLDDLLHRFHDPRPKKILEACLQNVMEKIPQIRESYAGMKKNYSNSELARMMVMDGCFILEFCFKHNKEDLHLPNKKQTLRIAMDLMLLENQVPFVVLKGLFDCLAPCIFGKKGYVTLSQVLNTYLAPYIKLFDSQLREEIQTTAVDSDSTHDHVLGYLHRRYQLVVAKSSNPKHAEASKPVDEELAAVSLNPVDAEAFRGHTIVELDRSGMNFKPHQEDVWSMTIKFQSSLFACLPWFWKPTLLMPTLIIDDMTELILRNFIAYEQSFPQDHYNFTSYAHAMDMLIDTQEDVAKLVESKVLVNKLVSNQEAADMINGICKNMFVTDFYYTEEFKQMVEYYNRFWPKHKRIYFSNPWNAFNLLLGIIVFLATVVAALFAVLDYFR